MLDRASAATISAGAAGYHAQLLRAPPSRPPLQRTDAPPKGCDGASAFISSHRRLLPRVRHAAIHRELKGRPKRTRNLVAVVKAVAQKQGKFGRHSEGSNPALSATSVIVFTDFSFPTVRLQNLLPTACI